jgi:hypothetical protein
LKKHSEKGKVGLLNLDKLPVLKKSSSGNPPGFPPGSPQSRPASPVPNPTATSSNAAAANTTTVVTSLEADVKIKEELKHNPELERMAKEWIEKVIEEPFPHPSFVQSLKSGVILCK